MGNKRVKINVFERIQNDNIDIMKFVLDGVSLELANAFRRIILEEVPCMAVDEVIFLENDSPLFDEIIAHRLGLVPLTTDLENYNLPEDCTCGGTGCTLCQVELTCSMTADLDGEMVRTGNLSSTDPKVKPVNDRVIIAKLQKNSMLEFEAYARLGLGMDHAKWQPVSAVGFGYYPDVTIDDKKCAKCSDPGIATKRCPEQIIDFDKKASMVKDYEHSCTICGACEQYCPEEAITVEYVKNKYVFTVEGSGALPIKEVLLKATDILEAKIDEFTGYLSDDEAFPE